MSLCTSNILNNYDNLINKEEVEGHILFRDIKTCTVPLFHVAYMMETTFVRNRTLSSMICFK